MTTKEFYWFNLPTVIKEKMVISNARAAEIPSINQATFNAKVAEAKWHRLPELLQELVDQINSESTAVDTTISSLVFTWFNLPASVEILYNAVQTGVLTAATTTTTTAAPTTTTTTVI